MSGIKSVEFKEKHPLEPCWDSLIIYYRISLAMKKAAKKWGDLR